MSTARRRVLESLHSGDSDCASGVESHDEQSRQSGHGGMGQGEGEQAREGHVLVGRGLELYEKAERSGFQSESALQESLQCFVQAADGGSCEALHWIASFLDALPSLPASVSVGIPDSMRAHMEWLRRSTEIERQIRTVAKSMFWKMAGSDAAIPRCDFSKRSRGLCGGAVEGSSPAAVVKSAQQLEGAVKNLLHGAVLQSGSSVVSCDGRLCYPFVLSLNPNSLPLSLCSSVLPFVYPSLPLSRFLSHPPFLFITELGSFPLAGN